MLGRAGEVHVWLRSGAAVVGVEHPQIVLVDVHPLLGVVTAGPTQRDQDPAPRVGRLDDDPPAVVVEAPPRGVLAVHPLEALDDAVGGQLRVEGRALPTASSASTRWMSASWACRRIAKPRCAAGFSEGESERPGAVAG